VEFGAGRITTRRFTRVGMAAAADSLNLAIKVTACSGLMLEATSCSVFLGSENSLERAAASRDSGLRSRIGRVGEYSFVSRYPVMVVDLRDIRYGDYEKDGGYIQLVENTKD